MMQQAIKRLSSPVAPASGHPSQGVRWQVWAATVVTVLVSAGVPAQAQLERPPSFTKSFVPDTIAAGETSTLTFTIDNTASAAAATELAFTDDLPAAITVADPADASTTCTGGTLTAPAGGSTITYSGGTVAAGASCTVQVEVTSSTLGTHTNTSGDLTSSSGNSGTATDDLIVNEPPPSLSKSFTDDPAAPGDTVTLEFSITNPGDTPLTDIEFTDDLDAVIAGLSATDLPQSDICGAGSTLTGTSVVTLTGGTLGPSASCTFSTTLQIPTDAPAGTFENITSPLAASAGEDRLETDPATATLEVTEEESADLAVALEATVIGNPTAELTVTASNAGPAFATGVGVTLDLPECVLLVSDDCGADPGPPWFWDIGNLDVDASLVCTLTLDLVDCEDPPTVVATIEGDLTDPEPANNTDELVIEAEVPVPAVPTPALVLLVALLASGAAWSLRRATS